MLHIRCLTDAQKLMVVDGNGKVVYATSALASMLATKVPSLIKMHLPQLIPPPIAQLHRLWMKVSCWSTTVQAGIIHGLTGVSCMACLYYSLALLYSSI